MLFCGIDLHSNNSFVVISDENDNVLYSKRLPNNLEIICAALSPYRAQMSGVVVESTFNWYWLVDGLQEAGHTVHLANTAAIKQYDGLKHRRAVAGSVLTFIHPAWLRPKAPSRG